MIPTQSILSHVSRGSSKVSRLSPQLRTTLLNASRSCNTKYGSTATTEQTIICLHNAARNFQTKDYLQHLFLRAFSSNSGIPPLPPPPPPRDNVGSGRNLENRNRNDGSKRTVPFRLRRPAAPDFMMKSNTSQEVSTLAAFNRLKHNQRAGAVVLFPGDFGDDPNDEPRMSFNITDGNWDDGTDDDSEDEEDYSDLDDDDDVNRERKMKLDREYEQLLVMKEMKRRDQELRARKQRWAELAQPRIRHSIIDGRGRSYGRGGRKNARARVWIQPGFGEVIVNRRPFDEYFQRLSNRDIVMKPLVITETCGLFDLQCMVEGGGLTGQAGAIRHGIARALNHYNPDLYRPALKRLGLLTRDPRVVERKKIGLKKARKAPQWVRR